MRPFFSIFSTSSSKIWDPQFFHNTRPLVLGRESFVSFKFLIFEKTRELFSGKSWLGSLFRIFPHKLIQNSRSIVFQNIQPPSFWKMTRIQNSDSTYHPESIHNSRSRIFQNTGRLVLGKVSFLSFKLPILANFLESFSRKS